MSRIQGSMSGTRRTRRRMAFVALQTMVVMSVALIATGAFASTTHAATPTNNHVFKTQPNTPIPGAITNAEAFSTIAVSGLTGTVTKVTVSLYAEHNPMDDLDGAVIAPDNVIPSNPDYAVLFDQFGISGNSLGTTCQDAHRTSFDDDAATAITAGSSPYEGLFKPQTGFPGATPLSQFNGMTAAVANGQWGMDLFNTATSTGGSIDCWSIFITTTDQTTPVRFDNDNSVAFSVPATGAVESPLVVSNMKGSIATITVSLWITDPDDSALKVSVIDPAGDRVTVLPVGGATGQNLGSSCTGAGLMTFSDTSTNLVSQSAAPYAGTFTPGEPLAAFKGVSGAELNGEWELRVTNTSGDASGIVKCWSLSMTSTALAITPRVYAPPLPGAYAVFYFQVTNSSRDTLKNVTVSAKTSSGTPVFRRDANYHPECSLSGAGVLSCPIGTINPKSTEVTDGLVRFGTPTNGKICITETATAKSVLPVTRTSCFTAGSYAQPDQGNGYTKGALAHNVRLKNQNGTPVSLSQFKGKYVLLQWSSVWCPPSQIEVPQDRDEVAALNASNAMGVKVVYIQVLIDGPNVNVASTQHDAHNWAAHFGLTTPVLWSASDKGQNFRQQATSYAVFGGAGGLAVPTSVFIDPNGKIFDLRVGVGAPGDTTHRFTSHPH